MALGAGSGAGGARSGLLTVLLNQRRAPQAAPPPVGSATEVPPTAPAGRLPTLPVVLAGNRYSVGISAFTPTVEVGEHSAPPGRHFLVASLVVRNDQQDRSAPAFLDSEGDAPAVVVGLAPVGFLPPAHTLRSVTVCDCDNNPRNARGPLPSMSRGLPAQTCLVEATASPAGPVGSDDDSTMAPGALNYGIVRTIDLPDDVPAPQVSGWLATSSTDAPQGSAAVFDRVPHTTNPPTTASVTISGGGCPATSRRWRSEAPQAVISARPLRRPGAEPRGSSPHRGR